MSTWTPLREPPAWMHWVSRLWPLACLAGAAASLLYPWRLGPPTVAAIWILPGKQLSFPPQTPVMIAGEIILLLQASTVFVMHVHSTRPCPHCATMLPLDAAAEAARQKPVLRIAHVLFDLLGSWWRVGAFVLLPQFVLPLGWPLNIFGALLFLALAGASWCAWRHSPLQPWCPWCNPGGWDEDKAVEPEPGPRESLPVT